MNNKILNLIKDDCFRYTGKKDFRTLVKLFISNRVFRFLTIFRLQEANNGMVKLLWKLNSTKRMIQLSPGTKIDGGLFIVHYAPIFVNPSAIIGKNCTLSQCVTIGSNCLQAGIIGDNVYIGPNVCVVENVKIGNNVTIGAGSIVTKDIPDNATACGNYAKVINYNKPGRFIGNQV